MTPTPADREKARECLVAYYEGADYPHDEKALTAAILHALAAERAATVEECAQEIEVGSLNFDADGIGTCFDNDRVPGAAGIVADYVRARALEGK